MTLITTYRIATLLLCLAALCLPPAWTGCSIALPGYLRNDTGDTLHLSFAGYDTNGWLEHFRSPRERAMPIDTLRRTGEMDLPPGEAVYVGYSWNVIYPERGRHALAFDSVLVVGPRFRRWMNDSTFSRLSYMSGRNRVTFILER